MCLSLHPDACKMGEDQTALAIQNAHRTDGARSKNKRRGDSAKTTEHCLIDPPVFLLTPSCLPPVSLWSPPGLPPVSLLSPSCLPMALALALLRSSLFVCRRETAARQHETPGAPFFLTSAARDACIISYDSILCCSVVYYAMLCYSIL